MPRDLFGDVTSPSITLGSRKWYTVPLSLVAHTAILVPIVLVPLLATDVLPSPRELMTVTIVDPPTPPEPPAPRREIEKPRPAPNPDAAPLVTPEDIKPELPGFEPVDAVAGVPEGLVSGAEIVIEPPPPSAIASPHQPMRPGGQVKYPVKRHHVAPLYPVIAQHARIQGVVILEATIDVNGKVENVRVLRPLFSLLDQAALDAVRQWEYSPSTLNGVPVPVIVTVTVTFTLNKE
jgi:protein TonB